MLSPYSRRLAASLVFLGFAAWVLLRFERVENPTPLVMAATAAVWLALLTAAAAGPGLAVWRWVTGHRPTRWESAPLVLGLGSTVLAGLAGALALLRWLRPGPVGAVLVASAVWGTVSLAKRYPVPELRVPAGARLPVLLVGAAFFLAFVLLLTDAPFFDQLHYHLGFPFHWLRQGTVFVLLRHQYSFIAGTMSLLYCYPLLLPGTWAAQAVHWWAGLCTLSAVSALARRLAGPRAAAWSAAILGTTAPVVMSATWAGVDLGAALWGMSGVLAVVLARSLPEPRRWRAYLAAGALAGAAAGAKILAAATIGAPMALLVLWLADGGWGRRARALLVWSAGVALTLVPWLGRNLMTTGRPLYPFGPTAWFATQEPTQLAAGQQIGALTSPLGQLGQVLTLTTFAPQGDAGPIGPVYLVLLLPAVWSAGRGRSRLARALLVAGALGLLGWGIGPLWGRYAIPTLALLAPLAAGGWGRLRRGLAKGWRPAADGLLSVLLVWGLLGSVTPVQLERLACSVGVGSAEDFLRRHVSYWPAVGFVNQSLPASARILMVAEARSMYLDRDLVIEDPFRTPLLAELANSAADTAALEGELRRRGITHLLYNQHEAARIAAMTGRAEYFASLTAGGRQRMMELRRDSLETVFRDGPVAIMRWRSPGEEVRR
ncbi:MAG: hypothetical protein KA072_00170 [Thermoanaerobaculaceae bacterium]|nr:hypothetical protein [Thermoanaerobaculaceae bacterium]MDI9621334.1 hypothetical protein [Acidobacteriota bacterium]NLH10954.1 hypothetical protein [Holophagae bacterium]HPW54134.1 hypothetical protein [Thermoanaerobaculaceae bacterium]